MGRAELFQRLTKFQFTMETKAFRLKFYVFFFFYKTKSKTLPIFQIND